MAKHLAVTPGQIAYEADLQAQPYYNDGGIRPSWLALDDIARWSWERNPTSRVHIGASHRISGEAAAFPAQSN